SPPAGEPGRRMPSRPPAAPPGPTYPIARLAGTVHRHVPRSSAALNPTTSRLARRWPVLLLLAVPVLLPVGRTAELPLVVGAVAGIVLALRQRLDFRGPGTRLACILFAC